VTRLIVLLEGESDAPTVREILSRRFGLVEDRDYQLHPHRGKGRLPGDLLSPPRLEHRGLLDQLPAKLRGFSYLGPDACVVVLVDCDDQPCQELLQELNDMLRRLPKRPARVLFRIAIEETESWFVADCDAVALAYPKAKVARLRRIPADGVVGAWEQLAAAVGAQVREVTGATKREWATRIAPYLDLAHPRSPSLGKFVEGIGRVLTEAA
jgi:Domain of unknown function (DUF4276)